MTPQDFKSSCRARFASGVGSIPTHSRQLLARLATAALLLCGPAALLKAEGGALAVPGAPAPADSPSSGAVADSAGLIRTPRNRLQNWRPRWLRSDSTGTADRGASGGLPIASPESLAPGAGDGGTLAPALATAIDSAVAYPIYELPGQEDRRFGPAASSDSTRPAAIAYPRPRPGLVMLRSALVPGWGQLTNGRWWKAILAAGLEGTLAAGALGAGRDVRRARDSLCAGLGPAGCDSLESVLTLTGDPRVTSLSSSRDRRVAYVWWTVGSIGLAMLDAYVDAHFKNFDVRPIARLDALSRGALLGVRLAWRIPNP